jgi:hypothetical protein
MGLTHEEASLLLEAAEESGPRDDALVRLLLLNGPFMAPPGGARHCPTQ